MSARHTPGPWFIDDDGDIRSRTETFEFDGEILPQLVAGIAYASRPENLALIAAAPELLELARDIAEWLALPDPGDARLLDRGWIDKLNAAVAKAEGRHA